MTDLEEYIDAYASTADVETRLGILAFAMYEHGSPAIDAASARIRAGGTSAEPSEPLEMLQQWLAGASIGDNGPEEAERRAQVGLESWVAYSADNAEFRAVFAPHVAEWLLRLPVGHPLRDLGAAEQMLQDGLAAAAERTDRLSLLNGASMLLQFFPPPYEAGSELIEASLPALEDAGRGASRTFSIVAAEYLHREAWRLPPAQGPLLRRQGLLLLASLLDDEGYEPHLQLQHITLAAQLHFDLNQPGPAVELLRQGVALAPEGSESWGICMVEMGLGLNDLRLDAEAATVLSRVLIWARERGLGNPFPDLEGVHRTRELSDVVAALAESLAATGDVDWGFEMLSLAFVDDEGRSEAVSASTVSQGLSGDEIALVTCLNRDSTTFAVHPDGRVEALIAEGFGATWWVLAVGQTNFLATFVPATERPHELDLPKALQALREATQPALQIVADYVRTASVSVVRVVPHRTLTMVPLWLLEGLDTVSVALAPSPSSLVSSPRPPTQMSLLAMADPGSDLTFARLEVEALTDRTKDLVAATVLQRDQCTPAALVEHLPLAGWFHFAGHAVGDFTDPDRACLYLHEDGAREAFHPTQVMRLDCSGVGLAVLSACSSGVHEFRIDQVTRLAGIPAAFMRSGAGSVISTLWKVDDAGAAILIDALTAAIVRAIDVNPLVDLATALHEAVREIRQMTPADIAGRFETLARLAEDPALAAVGRRAAGRFGSSDVAAPFGSPDWYGAFFLSGSRFVLFT